MNARPEPIVLWQPQPKQEMFITCPVDDVGFGGARGGGKSDAVIGDWLDHEDRYGRDAIGMAFRRERTQLVELIERARQILVPLGHKWHEQDKYFRGPKGGRLRFSYLERDADADAYQGHSYSRLYPEEMGTFPKEAPINKLMGTLRSGNGVPCQMKGTCNPGGPGHQWVKQRYHLDTHRNGFELFRFEFINPFTKAKIEKTRIFIPSRLTDNRFLGDDYVASLFQVGSDALVRSWLEGDWDAIEGAFFDAWDPRKHIVAPFAIPPDWLRFRSMDWGYASPSAIYWWAVVGDTVELPREGITLPRGCLVAYREWYPTKLTAEELAAGIKEREIGEAITYGVLDPSAFAQAGGPSHAERMAKEGVFFRPADNKRLATIGALGGWDQMRARIRGDNDGNPMMVVFDTCRDFIRTVPVLQHDADRPEDLDTEAEDHCFTGDTLVSTDRGMYCLAELIGRDGQVRSDDGRWHSFRSARLVKRDQAIVCLTFSDGSVVRCTPDHRFLTTKGWEEAANLRGLSLRRSRSSAASAITSAAFTFSARASGCIASFGRRPMGQFRRVITSITRTAIDPATAWPILRPFQASSTSAIAMVRSRGDADDAASAEQTRPRVSGTAAPRGASGTGSIIGRIARMYFTSRSSMSAANAGHISAPDLLVSSARTNARRRFGGPLAWITSAAPAQFAVRHLRRIATASSERARGLVAWWRARGRALVCLSISDAGRADVYCLTVPDTGNFTLANGAIVANCADSARYACLSRPWVPEKPQGKPMGRLMVGQQNEMTLDEAWDSVPAPTGRV